MSGAAAVQISPNIERAVKLIVGNAFTKPPEISRSTGFDIIFWQLLGLTYGVDTDTDDAAYLHWVIETWNVFDYQRRLLAIRSMA